MPPRAFISFEMEDKWARDFLVQHAKDQRNGIEFLDYSVKAPWDSAWKTQCKERIARTKGTIVLIGATTYASDAVKWEIAETLRQGHHLFGVQIHAQKTFLLPPGLSSGDVIPWEFTLITGRLSTWV